MILNLYSFSQAGASNVLSVTVTFPSISVVKAFEIINTAR